MTAPTAEEVEAARAVLALAGEPAQDAPAKDAAPQRYKVVESLKRGNADRVFFTSVSKKRAQDWIAQHSGAGDHHFLLSPDGTMETYNPGWQSGGPRGEEYEHGWSLFDRDSYQAPELAPANTNDPWADAWEGAQ